MGAQKDKYPKLSANIAAINQILAIEPQMFVVGNNNNHPGENIGSLAILQYAVWRGLSIEETLPLFAEAYEEVLANLDGADHQNIRQLMTLDSLNEILFDYPAEIQPELLEIDSIWEERESFKPSNVPHDFVQVIHNIISYVNEGKLRAAVKIGDVWFTVPQVKKAILLSFRFSDNFVISAGDLQYYDKISTKFHSSLNKRDFVEIGVRVVPPAVARFGSYIAPGVILMPSYVNIGAYIDTGTMVDTWATVGSCAQIGKKVHLSGGVGIGGVLEPLQATPTIIEDDCFIGARSEIVEGVIVGKGSVIGMGCFIGQSTPIVDRYTGEITYGKIPPYSVVIAGSMPIKNSGLDGLHKNCVIIIKQVDERTRSKTGINELLRD